MEYELKPNTKALTEGFTDLEKRQLPFATALALTRTVQFAQAGIQKALPALLHQPTAFTVNSVRIITAKKADNPPRALVYLQDEAPKGTAPVRYLFPEVEGGERNETRFERALRFAGKLPAGMSVVPGVGAPKDAHGNVRNGFHSSVLSMLQASTDPYQNQTEHSAKRKDAAYKGKLFIGRPGGGTLPLGIYQRLGVRPLWIFVSGRPAYRKRLPFYQLVQGIFNAKYPEFFKVAFEEAIRTAK